jgi:RHS repeat-associated protein
MSRLTKAVNPESGTISYSYTASGGALCAADAHAVCSKTAPSPNQVTTGTATATTTYTYDKLNRLLGKNYTDGYTNNSPTPNAQYAYDGNTLTGCTIAPATLTDSYPIGRRTSMCDGSGATAWAHDKVGRVLQERRTINTVKGDYENDAFNLDGSVASATSLGYQVSYTYGGAALPLTATHSTTNFLTGATYAPPGELTGGTLGSATGFAGFTVNNAYNDRLQPILLSAAVTGQNPVFSECFDFHLGTAITGPAPCSFQANTTGNNGNVYQIVNNRTSTRSQSFLYDTLNRITSGESSGSQWGESYTLDAWGNMTAISPYQGKPSESFSATANTNNQLVGYGYDAAGNMILNGSTPYVYDDENRLIWTSASSGYRYIYDGDGERVEKCVAATSTTGCPTTSGTTYGTLYWRGLGSAPLSETDLAGNVTNTYIFFNGQRIARSDSAGAIHYYFSDHLGTHGVVENATGTVCEQDVDYYPYGGQQDDYCPNVAQHYKFTGKERDTESNLDNFGARYNASSMGRFMTPDPSTNLILRAINPQRWNMYAYSINNPTNYVDPDGRDAAAVNFSGMVGGLGHEGLVIISNDGTATYARFGPVDHSLGSYGGASGQGAVSTYSNLPTVQFGANGLPTDASIKALAGAVAQDESSPGNVIDPNTVRINYFQTGSSDTAMLKQWAETQKNGAYGHYCVSNHNCATFTAAGLVAGGALTAAQANGLSVDPNRLFNQLRGFANISYEFDLLSKQLQHQTACVSATDSSGQGTGTHCE